MLTMDILGDNRFPVCTKSRIGCRGIVLRGEEILLSREENTDYWLLPGGGLEAGETLAACCQREVLEETGCIVDPGTPFLLLREYYEEYCYASYFFLCEVQGAGSMHLTDMEKQRGLTPRWLPLREAVEIFSRHAAYADTQEEKRGAYLREYTALLACAAFRAGSAGDAPLYIETDRLLITEFCPEMAREVHRNSLDEDNRRFVPDEVFETEAEAAETVAFLISRYGGADGPFVYPVLLKTGENIGYVQAAPVEEGWEIGYHIAKAYTGKGYATEALAAFLPAILKKLGLREILGVCLRENAASARVMEKCGFRRLFAGKGPYQGEMREIVKNVWTVPED